MNKDTAKNKALVVGDLMLDESIFGTASRLTPEGPVPVILKNKTEYTFTRWRLEGRLSVWDKKKSSQNSQSMGR